MDQFVWQPGQGIDPAALARLRAKLKRPARPMGEAWFMGNDRHYFNELLDDIDHSTGQAWITVNHLLSNKIKIFFS